MMNFAMNYGMTALNALETSMARCSWEQQDRPFIADLFAAEKVCDRKIAEPILARMDPRTAGLARLRKTCLFDYEQQDVWDSICAAAKAFDDAFC